MIIIKETNRQIGVIKDYIGVCNGCQSPLEYADELIVIEVEVTEDRVTLVPKDRLVCPECNKELTVLFMYRNLEVTEEFAKLREGSK